MININTLDFCEQQYFWYLDNGHREPKFLSSEAIHINKKWAMVKPLYNNPKGYRLETIKNVTNEMDQLPEGTYEGVLVKFEVTKKGKRQSEEEEFILMYWEEEDVRESEEATGSTD